MPSFRPCQCYVAAYDSPLITAYGFPSTVTLSLSLSLSLSLVSCSLSPLFPSISLLSFPLPTFLFIYSFCYFHFLFVFFLNLFVSACISLLSFVVFPLFLCPSVSFIYLSFFFHAANLPVLCSSLLSSCNRFYYFFSFLSLLPL